MKKKNKFGYSFFLLPREGREKSVVYAGRVRNRVRARGLGGNRVRARGPGERNRLGKGVWTGAPGCIWE